MHDFTLPANIKQIGSIGTGLRIYMEDYVCTFLHQYATSGGYDERLAYLVGRQMVIDGQQFLFISGAMYGMYAEQVEGYSRFSAQSAEYAAAMLDEHFPGLEIVGWMQSQPSYGTYLNQHYAAYHLRQFPKPYQVMFVMDPLERVNAFYTANANAITPADRMAEIGGYFIYYEKNVNMHEYMLTNKTVDYSTKTPPPTFVEITPVDPVQEDFEEPVFFANGDEDDDYDKNTTRFTYDSDPDDVIRRHKANTAKRRVARADQRRASGLLAGLCAVLFVVSFVMGVGLIRNQDDIRRMEAQIQQLVTAHRNLFAQLYSPPQAAPVFAEAAAPAEMATAESEYTPAYVPAPAVQVAEPAPAAPAVQPAPAVAPVAPAAAEPEAVPVYYEPEAIIPPIPETYTIRPGDSLLAISLYFFGNINMVDAILELNGIENPDLIVAGRTILLPQQP